MKPELAPAARLLQERRAALSQLPSFTGRIGEAEVLMAAGGLGQRRAEAAAGILAREWKPDLLLMAGVAGALCPKLGVGDIVVANSVYAGAEVLAPATSMGFTPSPAKGGGGQGVGLAPILSIDRILVTAEEKQTAFSPPVAVEMETAGLATAANAAGVPWAAVRAISDAAHESLPLDFNRLRSKDGDLPTSRVALAAITHPSAIPRLIRLGKNTSIAAEALARFLGEWFEAGCPTI